jgi:uncharacterized membrane protein
MNIVHFHLLVLHFPIVLLLAGALLEVLAVVSGRRDIRSVARASVVLGALSAFATAWSGEEAEEAVEKSLSVTEAILERHEELGMLAAYVAAALLLVELASLRIRGRALQWGVTLLAVATAVLVALAGFSGGRIRHDADFEGGSGAASAAPFVPIPESKVDSGE